MVIMEKGEGGTYESERRPVVYLVEEILEGGVRLAYACGVHESDDSLLNKLSKKKGPEINICT